MSRSHMQVRAVKIICMYAAERAGVRATKDERRERWGEEGEAEKRNAHQEFLTIQDVAVIPTMVTAWLGAVL